MKIHKKESIYNEINEKKKNVIKHNKKKGVNTYIQTERNNANNENVQKK